MNDEAGRTRLVYLHFHDVEEGGAGTWSGPRRAARPVGRIQAGGASKVVLGLSFNPGAKKQSSRVSDAE